VIDLSMVAAPAAGAEEESSAPEPAERAQTEETADAVTVPPTAIEDQSAAEEDPLPDTMPPAKEEEAAEVNDTPKMEDLIQEEIERNAASEAAEQMETEELPMPDEAQPLDEPPQSGSDVEGRLNVTVDIEFNDTPLHQVLDKLQLITGMNMVVDQPALDREGIAKDWPISITLEGVKIKSALDVILGNYNLTYLVKDGMLVIRTSNSAQAAAAEAQEHSDHCKSSGCGGCYVKDETADPADKTAAAEGQDTWDFWMQFFRFDDQRAADAAEELPMPAEATDKDQPSDDAAAAAETPEPATQAAESPAGEESEAMPGMPPDCREDPHHDQQYPGCPYMGGCSGKSATPHSEAKAPVLGGPTADYDVPSDDHASTPIYHDRPETGSVFAGSLIPYHPESADVLPGSFTEAPVIRRVKYEEFAAPSAERRVRHDHFDWLPALPKVDTMEFRPSDAQPGEFDPKPF
jgi:cytochrome c551/c552